MARIMKRRRDLPEPTPFYEPTDEDLADPEFRGLWEDAEARDRLILMFYRLRKDRGWSQIELAKRLRVTQSAVSEFEKSVSEPRVATLQRWARVFGYRLDIGLRPRGPLSGSEEWVSRSFSYETILGDITTNDEVTQEWLLPEATPGTQGEAMAPVAVSAVKMAVGSVQYKDPAHQTGFAHTLATELAASGAK